MAVIDARHNGPGRWDSRGTARGARVPSRGEIVMEDDKENRTRGYCDRRRDVMKCNKEF